MAPFNDPFHNLAASSLKGKGNEKKKVQDYLHEKRREYNL
jgi:hypothetical protein